jgi:hypothetical protein
MDWMRFLPCDRTAKIPRQLIELPRCELGQSPLELAIQAVNDIVAKYPAPYTLMLSGGIDSQAMLYAWVKAGVEFNTLTFQYGHYNLHDIEALQRFVDALALPITLTYMDFNVISFLENEYDQYATKYDCSSPQICTHIRCSEWVKEGTVVFSGNFVMSPTNGGPMLSHAILGIRRYAEIEQRSIVPFFFLHTPQLAYSFIPYEIRGAKSAYEMKTGMYRAAGFPILPQADKYTGFERIKDQYDNIDVSLKTKLQYAEKPSTRPFDLIYRYPYETKFNDPRVDFIFSFLKDKP